MQQSYNMQVRFNLCLLWFAKIFIYIYNIYIHIYIMGIPKRKCQTHSGFETKTWLKTFPSAAPAIQSDAASRLCNKFGSC